jgi:hypothetical protein
MSTKLPVVQSKGVNFNLVTTESRRSRKVIAFTTDHPVPILILSQDGVDMGYEKEKINGMAVDLTLDITVTELDGVVRVKYPNGESESTLGNLDDFVSTPPFEKLDDYLISILRGVAPGEERPPWDEVYKHLERIGAKELVKRLKAHYNN